MIERTKRLPLDVNHFLSHNIHLPLSEDVCNKLYADRRLQKLGQI